MFSNEIIVKGNYVSGTIKKNTTSKDQEEHSYLLYSGLNLGSSKATTWSADKLREMADELLQVAAKIDKQNGIKYPPTIKWDCGVVDGLSHNEVHCIGRE